MSKLSNKPVRVYFTEDSLWVLLADGRGIRAPLKDIFWLNEAFDEDRECYDLGDSFIWWESLDQGFDIEEMTRMFPVLDKTDASLQRAFYELRYGDAFDLSALWEQA